jgi:hypothetical protein
MTCHWLELSKTLQPAKPSSGAIVDCVTPRTTGRFGQALGELKPMIFL